MVTRTLTIVFTDIKGFTERTSRISRADMMRILEKHEELLKPYIVQHGGTVIKTIGDAFLLTFESPTNAVLCGLRMQACLKQYNSESLPEDQIEIRIAINSGEVERTETDVFGETVNLASRVEGVTDAGEIYFTEATYLVMNKSEVPTSAVGEFQFKGIPGLIKLFRVVQDENLDLYKKVIGSSEVYDDVKNVEASVPQGAYSVDLLKAFEAQRKKRSIRNSIVTAIVVLLVAGGYFGFQSYQYSVDRNKAKQMIGNGQFSQALELLTALRDKKPTDTELFSLVGEAVGSDIRQFLSKEQFEMAITKLDEYSKTYPNLNLDNLDRDSQLEYSLDLIIYKSQRMNGRQNLRKGRKIQRELLDKYPQDQEIRFKIGKALASADDHKSATAWFMDVVDSKPDQYKNNELIINSVKKSLEAGIYKIEVSVGEHYLDLIDKYYYAKFKPQLLEYIADPTPIGPRVSAYYLLNKNGDLTPTDEFRFYMVELLTLDLMYGGFKDALKYFENLIKEGYPEEFKSIKPDKALPEPLILKYKNSSGRSKKFYKRANKIFKTFFPKFDS